jgi:DNA-directed RNA polymerase I subunit RPA43
VLIEVITATAVSRIDNLEFLADVIPKTTTYKQFKEKRAKETAKDTGVEKGQRTLNGALPPAPEVDEDAQDGKKEASVPRGSRPPTVMSLVDGGAEPQTKDDDVEMADS